MVHKQTKRPIVLIALVLSMFMAAIEGTIIATAMPNIVSDLGGFTLYSWVFSSFLLMQAVTTMIYGKLADLFGRKPIFVIGVVIFLIGSLLCGLAETMTALIIFRLIQGLGAGAIHPIVTTMVGDMYNLEERAKVQGYLASVWGISSVAGPLLGGVIVQYIDWAWLSPETLGLLGLFVICISLFIWQEKRCAAPMMPLSLWKNKLMIVANIATLLSGMIILGLSSSLPTYVQGVMEESAIVAGFTLSTLSIGWPIAATAAGHMVLRIGFRKTAFLGGIALFVGTFLFFLLDAEKGPIYAGFSSFIVGIGMGLTSTTFIVAIQNSVSWQARGSATSLNMFMRIIGSAIGTALLGGILNLRLQQYYQQQAIDEDMPNTNAILNEGLRESIPPDTLALMQDGLTQAFHTVFFGLFVIGTLTFIILWFFPKDTPKDT